MDHSHHHGVAMEMCELMDCWSYDCIEVPIVLFQILPAILSVMVVTLVGVFAIYIHFCHKARRPRVRGVSFALLIFGLLLGVPKFLWRATTPGMDQHLPPKHIFFIFAFGDVANHVGFVMLIYWDIVAEGIRLAFALDPHRKKLVMKASRTVGTICMVVEVVALVPFWILIYYIEELWPELPRRTLCSSFAVVQYVLVFGIVPSFAFGKLSQRLQRLWKDLPGDIPRNLLYRLRFTQLCLALLTLLGLADTLTGLFVAFLPALTSYSAFLYENVALLSLCGLTQVLLGVELFLTYQQARRRTGMDRVEFPGLKIKRLCVESWAGCNFFGWRQDQQSSKFGGGSSAPLGGKWSVNVGSEHQSEHSACANFGNASCLGSRIEPGCCSEISGDLRRSSG